MRASRGAAFIRDGQLEHSAPGRLGDGQAVHAMEVFEAGPGTRRRQLGSRDRTERLGTRVIFAGAWLRALDGVFGCLA